MGDEDEDVCDVFEITRDTARRFCDGEECHVTTHTAATANGIAPETSHVTNAVFETSSCSDPDLQAPAAPGVCDHTIPDLGEREPCFFDPEDAKINSLGHAATMSIVTECPPDTPADDLISYLSCRELTGFDLCNGHCDGGHPGALMMFSTPRLR
jgi:hypothetical protein